MSKVWRSLLAYQCRYFQGYTFEDTLWSCGDNDLLVGATNVNMNIFVRGRGLRFAPYEGRTYTVRRKIRGDGGVVTVGHYEGTEPDVTLWRGRNFKTRGLRASFSAKGGDIVATVKVPGLMLIVR